MSIAYTVHGKYLLHFYVHPLHKSGQFVHRYLTVHCNSGKKS